jgi:streptomycin 6-kinase
MPKLVSSLSSRLGLRDLKEVANLTYHYVLSGLQGDNPIILKLGLDSESLKREAFALKCFADCGVVKVLAEDDCMLLLERVVPGISLQRYFPNQEQESIEIACGVMKKLHQANIPKNHNFPHIKDWLMVLDKDWSIPDANLQKARKIRDQLLKTASANVLLHGDLHHDNILQSGDDEAGLSLGEGGWMVIDPKGVIGELAYEVAAFIRNPPSLLRSYGVLSPMPELLSADNAVEMIQNRIAMFANLLELTPERILDWCFVGSVLSWSWNIQDNLDTSYFEKLTKIFDDISI